MAVTFDVEDVQSQAMPTAVLGLAAKTLDDIEHLRKAAANRVRALTRSEEDKDGEDRGLGLDERHPDVAMAMNTLNMIGSLEAEQVKNLQKIMKKHPLGPFVKQAKGVGEKQAARLIAATGDPYWADRTEKTSDGKIISIVSSPRTLREFLAYCGYGIAPGGGEARRIQKGMDQKQLKALGTPEAKMRVYLIANSIVKTKGEYRDVYDTAREKYEMAVHTVECKRCGPSGKPAQPGSLLSAGHQHARALRLVSKKVLTDLYFAAKDWHESERPNNVTMYRING